MNREPTAAELDLIASCGPDEACMIFEGELVKLGRERIEALYEVAFKSAMTTACELAGIRNGSQLAEYRVETAAPGLAFVRVSVTSDKGVQASGIGMVPDPRVH